MDTEPKFQPEFESGYVIPQMDIPPEHLFGNWLWGWGNVLVLAAALAVGVWLVHKRRSRLGIVLLGAFSLVYFGFLRHGCVCPIGSVQNVVEGIGCGTGVSMVILAIFLLPLVVALFWGRVFCSGICPLGAIQDVMVIGRPKTLPRWLDAGLTLIRSAYFWLAVLVAGLGAGYLICRYDPFVGFFRMGGFPHMLIFGGILLVLGVVVARPYCRYICPYGLLLEWVSRFAKKPVQITPSPCIACKLCAGGCPFDAIEAPSTGLPPEGMARSRRSLAWRLALAPLVLAACVGLAWKMSPALAELHVYVKTASDIRAAEKGGQPSGRVRAFEENGGDAQSLLAAAEVIKKRFAFWTPLAGFMFGLAVCARFVNLGTHRSRSIFEIHSGRCVACGRCYGYCPLNRKRKH